MPFLLYLVLHCKTTILFTPVPAVLLSTPTVLATTTSLLTQQKVGLQYHLCAAHADGKSKGETVAPLSPSCSFKIMVMGTGL